MHRRTFVTIAAGTVAGLAFGVRALTRTGGEAAVQPGPRYLARHESGVWGITDDPAAEEGVWVRHSSGVLGIAPPGTPGALRMWMTEAGVIGIAEEGEVEREEGEGERERERERTRTAVLTGARPPTTPGSTPRA